MKKLKETFAFIQQLDKNMSSLRTWLARIESELSKPVVYDVCDDQEIQKRLAEQQVRKGEKCFVRLCRKPAGLYLPQVASFYTCSPWLVLPSEDCAMSVHCLQACSPLWKVLSGVEDIDLYFQG